MTRRLRAPRIDFSQLRRELELPSEYPLAAWPVKTAPSPARPRADRTGVEFVTIDPAGSMDLDQAVCLTRREVGGYRVYYAIADVAAFVPPGGELDAETWRRGATVYLPDARVPLHPFALSEGAASLLPDVDRPAVLWTIDLDADGATTAVEVERATVRSRAKLDYTAVQRDADAGTLARPVELLPEIGKLLVDRSLARGAVNLPMPEQEVVAEDGGWRLRLRAPVPVEEYNAQISLLTGMAAASIMLAGGIGLLRTMPPPPPGAVDRLRVVAGSLGVSWPDGVSVGRVVAAVDPQTPRGAAFVDATAELMRGAGYTAFDGPPPAQPGHGAVAAPYAHVTAPLRRLADRYAAEVCLSLHAGTPIPDWARAALPRLPDAMAAADRRASAADRGAIDLTEAVLLADRVGETFEAAVLDVDVPRHGDPSRPGKGVVAPDDPSARAGKGVAQPADPSARAGKGVAQPADPSARPGKGVAQPADPSARPGKGAAQPADPAARPGKGVVALDDPPVRARCDGDLPLGERVTVRLTTADPATRTVRFTLV